MAAKRTPKYSTTLRVTVLVNVTLPDATSLEHAAVLAESLKTHDHVTTVFTQDKLVDWAPPEVVDVRVSNARDVSE